MSAAICAALAVFDDAALEALANRGLLRRAAKDVEMGKITIAEESAARIVVAADGERVEMTAAGPRFSRCSCPATTVCRHKLAAVLLLRAPAGVSGMGQADGTAAALPSPSLPTSAGPLADVLAVPADVLRKWAGKGNLRAALDLLAETEPVIEQDGAALRVRLGDGWLPVTILAGQIGGSGGLDSIVSKTAPARQKSVHAAAVLAVWRAHGRDLVNLVDDLGETAVELPHPAFLKAVKATLEGALETAIAQAPEALAEQLFLLAVSSQADNLPALSRRLRQLSGSVRARNARDFTMQPAEMLSSFATAHALADALTANADLRAIARLRGVARQGYAAVGPLSLVGLAARLWETRGGARGVTGYFYAAELERVVSVGLVRVGEHDRLFDPATAFHVETLWRTAPLRQLMGARLHLQGARLSPQGRLSLAQETTGWRADWPPDLAEARAWPITFDDWHDLEARMQHRFALRLMAQREGAALAVLLPTAHAQPAFDAVKQVTLLPVQDKSGRWLTMQLPEGTAGARTEERLRAILSGRSVAMAIVEIAPAGDMLSPLPLALVLNNAEHAPPMLELIDPALAEPPGAARALPAPEPDDTAAPAIWPAAASSRRLLTGEIWDALLAAAELGIKPAEGERAKRFAAFAGRARDAGLATLADACSALAGAEPPDVATRTLRLAHLCERMASFDRRLPLAAAVGRPAM